MASHTESALNKTRPTHKLSTAELYDVETSDQDTINRMAEEMALRLAWPRQRVLDYQQEHLREILHHAATHSAYYRDTIGHLVESGAPLSDFPVMNKTTLMSEFDRIVTDPRLTRALVEEHAVTNRAGHLLLDEYRVASTGGSSGQRGVFVYDREAWDLTVANLRRMQRLMGLPPALRPVGIAAPSPVHLSNRFYAEMRAMFPDSPPLSVVTPMEKVVEALSRYLPDSISTYPSFIRRLADEQVAGRLKIAPILMRSVAEALAPDVRDLVRTTWNIPTTNSYASTEAGIMGSECREQSGIHLCDDMFLTEIVDDAYRPVSAGTTGAKVLITTLFNRTLPIVRYELSDYLTAIDGPCLCGCAFQRIKDIEGRREEMLRVWTPDGREVAVHAPRFWFHLVRVSGIKQYQFVQLPKGIAIRIVPTVGHNPETVRNEVDRIGRAALSALDAPEGHLEVQIVETIERSGAAAKQKLVASAPAT